MIVHSVQEWCMIFFPWKATLANREKKIVNFFANLEARPKITFTRFHLSYIVSNIKTDRNLLLIFGSNKTLHFKLLKAIKVCPRLYIVSPYTILLYLDGTAFVLIVGTLMSAHFLTNKTFQSFFACAFC